METTQRHRFRKAQKIKLNKEISKLFKSGKRWNCAWCLICYSENGKNRNRCVIVAPKSTGNAVERNSIKRCIREYLRYFLINTPLHIDILIKINPVKDLKNSKYRLKDALSLWLETLKK